MQNYWYRKDHWATLLQCLFLTTRGAFRITITLLAQRCWLPVSKDKDLTKLWFNYISDYFCDTGFADFHYILTVYITDSVILNRDISDQIWDTMPWCRSTSVIPPSLTLCAEHCSATVPAHTGLPGRCGAGRGRGSLVRPAVVWAFQVHNYL